MLLGSVPRPPKNPRSWISTQSARHSSVKPMIAGRTSCRRPLANAKPITASADTANRFTANPCPTANEPNPATQSDRNFGCGTADIDRTMSASGSAASRGPRPESAPRPGLQHRHPGQEQPQPGQDQPARPRGLPRPRPPRGGRPTRRPGAVPPGSTTRPARRPGGQQDVGAQPGIGSARPGEQEREVGTPARPRRRRCRADGRALGRARARQGVLTRGLVSNVRRRRGRPLTRSVGTAITRQMLRADGWETLCRTWW